MGLNSCSEFGKNGQNMELENTLENPTNLCELSPSRMKYNHCTDVFRPAGH